MVDPAPIANAPSAIKNTLPAFAPLINVIEEPAAAEKAPLNFKINTALLLP